MTPLHSTYEDMVVQLTVLPLPKFDEDVTRKSFAYRLVNTVFGTLFWNIFNFSVRSKMAAALTEETMRELVYRNGEFDLILLKGVDGVLEN